MEQRTCDVCGGAFERNPGRGRWPKWCSNECRRIARRSVLPKSCSDCGSPCSVEADRCRTCHVARMRESRWVGHASAMRQCAYCGQEFPAKRRSAKRGGQWIRCCSKSCARKMEIREGRHPIMAGKLRDENPDWKRNKAAKWTQKRRAKLASVEHEPYVLTEIAERDGFRCGICRRKVRMDLRYPHPRSASVDHIAPISWGGGDIPSNVQLAHLDCNRNKGARVEWAQEALIG